MILLWVPLKLENLEAWTQQIRTQMNTWKLAVYIPTTLIPAS